MAAQIEAIQSRIKIKQKQLGKLMREVAHLQDQLKQLNQPTYID